MKLRTALALAAASWTFASAPAVALPWHEINAGETLPTAEITTGQGALTQLSGTLDFDFDAFRWDIDLYAIDIVDPTLFLAMTLGSDDNVRVSDPVLYLFDFEGRGVYMNDDTDAGGNLQATLPAGSVLGPVSVGRYYLGIGWAFSDPLSAGGDSLFPAYEQSLPSDGVYGPTGIGGASPLASWSPGGFPNFDLGHDYVIALRGAAFAQQLVPEPAALLLLAAAAIAAAASRRRRR